MCAISAVPLVAGEATAIAFYKQHDFMDDSSALALPITRAIHHDAVTRLVLSSGKIVTVGPGASVDVVPLAGRGEASAADGLFLAQMAYRRYSSHRQLLAKIIQGWKTEGKRPATAVAIEISEANETRLAKERLEAERREREGLPAKSGVALAPGPRLEPSGGLDDPGKEGPDEEEIAQAQSGEGEQEPGEKDPVKEGLQNIAEYFRMLNELTR